MDTPSFTQAAVAAPHKSACEAGLAVLREGGNALEAIIAVASTIAVVYPHMNGIGGDSFWIIHEPSGKVRYIEACGLAVAAQLLRVDLYEADHNVMPLHHAISVSGVCHNITPSQLNPCAPSRSGQRLAKVFAFAALVPLNAAGSGHGMSTARP